jgi:hypothetical protein
MIEARVSTAGKTVSLPPTTEETILVEVPSTAEVNESLPMIHSFFSIST